MRSKTLYFNKTLFLKDLSRFWPLWGGASFIGALFPLAMDTQRPGDGKGDQQHGRPRQKAGHKQPLPPDGQGVHQAGGACVIEVVPHR